MKRIYIVSVGVSVLTNFKKGPPLSDEEGWERCGANSQFRNELLAFLLEKPGERAAEFSALRDYLNCPGEVYLIPTRSAPGNLACWAIGQVFREFGFTLIEGAELSARVNKVTDAKAFQDELLCLADRLLELVHRRREDGYTVIFNPTGGFKAEGFVLAMVAAMTGCEAVYVHETFRWPITYPPFLYIPRGQEWELIKLLQQLGGRVTTNDPAAYDRIHQNRDALDRLATRGIIDKSEGKIRLTHIGRYWLEWYRKQEKGENWVMTQPS